jgi:succinyl-diaminopimelate desuccinylase
VIIPEPLNKDRICLGHRGVWWAEVETFGRIAHGSMPFLGECAVRHMGAVVAEMEAALHPALSERKTAMPVVPEAARASTLNINSLHGGLAEPETGFTGWPSAVVPDFCRMVIDRRYLAEEQFDVVKAAFRAVVERALARAVERVMGRTPEYVVSPGTYDQKHIDRIGRLKHCVAYGPGILDLAHAPGEYVGEDDLADAALVMGLAFADVSGVGRE